MRALIFVWRERRILLISRIKDIAKEISKKSGIDCSERLTILQITEEMLTWRNIGHIITPSLNPLKAIEEANGINANLQITPNAQFRSFHFS
jgi:hypothetical protein